MGISWSKFNNSQQPEPSTNNEILFSYLYYNYKANSRRSANLLKNIRIKYALNLKQSDLSVETLVLVWCKEFLDLSKKGHFGENEKESMMRDFLDTLYRHENSFHHIFAYIFTASKSRSFILSRNTEMRFSLSYFEIYKVFTEILTYASTANLKYSNNRSGLDENPIDYPLCRSWGLCECTTRPVYAAAYHLKPHLLCRLLTLGACIPIENACPNCLRKGDSHPIDRILRYFKWMFSTRRSCQCFSTRRSCQCTSRNKKKAIICCSILLVDVPYYDKIWINITEAIRQLSNKESDGNIPSLKHICRFEIRHILKQRNKICKPKIWDELFLPHNFQSYMNIKYAAEDPSVTIT